MLHRRVTPPFVPRLSGPLDASHFRREADDFDETDEESDGSQSEDPEALADGLPTMTSEFGTTPCASVTELWPDGDAVT